MISRLTAVAQAVVCLCAATGHAPVWAQNAPQENLQLKIEPALQLRRELSDQALPSFVFGERIEGISERETVITGNAELRRYGMVLRADEIRYQQVDDVLDAQGHVFMLRDGNTYNGPSLHYQLDTGEGTLGPGEFTLTETGGHAQAQATQMEGPDVLRFIQARYSTCPRGDDSWYLQADEIGVDRTEGVGEARHAAIHFKGLPILASPYFRFPVNDQRRSGFLTPAFGVSSSRGIEIETPYYFNIAPNRDYTLTPRVLTKRGLQLGNEFRYLDKQFNGVTQADLVPSDKRTNELRWAFDSRHNQKWGAWNGYWAIARASDDQYFDDFARSVVKVSTRQLAQEGGVSYSNSWGNFNSRVQKFQVLQDANQTISKPYERLPQMTWNGQRFDLNGFDFGAGVDYTYFSHDSLVSGSRLVATPYVSYPLLTAASFVIPKISLNAASYSLNNQYDFNRALPTLSVDSGLTFERDAQWGGTPLLQTLEPRLFYVRTPYKDQSQVPLFDTGEPDLNFAQLFSENRFTGADRIADANQLTLALSSRFIQPLDGSERLRATLGQRFYFSDQLVGLDGSNTSTARKSDFLISFGGQLSKTWSVDSTAQLEAGTGRTTRANVGVRYSPSRAEIANLSYRLTRDAATDTRTLEQFDFSGQWRLSRQWFGVLRSNYSTLDKKITESLLGFEYRSSCWAARVAAQRFPTANGSSETSIFFQLDLNGFTSVGTSPLEALRRNIPGYRSFNEPTSSPSPLQTLQ